MSVNCGIVGLPNVGKSTIFAAITSSPAEVANYPFCTIDPNVGIVNVADKRLDKIAEIVKPMKVYPAAVEFLDIAGLVKGASKGEGLGNQFLGHIRSTNAIVHVVRCFVDDDITHVSGKIDPIEDIEVINIELALADLDLVDKRLSAVSKQTKGQDLEMAKKSRMLLPILEKLQKALGEGKSARTLNLDEEELNLVKELNLITLKKVLYVCNIDEDGITNENEYVKKVREYAKTDGAEVLAICGKLEAEISKLETQQEKKEFMEAAGISESGLDQLTHAAYKLLGLRTYFTAGVKEVRAWTFHEGTKAPGAAGVIHSDFERGFIRAEVYHCDDLFTLGSEAKVKEAGKLRVEGKEYVVKDGDVMHFRFNV